ncbi:MAG TPA: hypothetical protein VLM81_04035 [Peptostreptococcaceae bacterium]|nr:hypothetical protein [Peptostreptococcaceae bacterium]
MFNIYKRQQPNPIIMPTELQEQYELPIYKIMKRLKEGNIIKVALKIDGGFFVSAANGGGGYVFVNSIAIGPNETFLLVPQGLNRDKVAIRTVNGNYLSAVNGGEGLITTTGTMIGANEQFLMIGATPDRANFISEKGLLMFALINEPRFLTAYGVATGPRTRLIVIPQI